MTQSAESVAAAFPADTVARPSADPEIPAYLQQVYWWAYLHPNAVRRATLAEALRVTRPGDRKSVG